MKQFNSENKGFTLIELLVVIFIIGILTTISFPHYQSARQQLAVQRAANRLAQDIRRVQEMAMSVKRVDSSKCFDAGGGLRWPDDYEYGFGIYLTSGEQQKQYTLYADCNGDKRLIPGLDEDFELNIVDLVNIESIYIESTTDTYDYLNIIFTPPDPFVFLIAGDTPPGGLEVDQVSIVISAQGDPSKTKTVTVNKVGLVVIE